jgi:predicted nucleic acid-binding protein
MIVLDTNIISEVVKPQPNAKILAWLGSQPIGTLYLTSITIAESLFGLAAMPDGSKKTQLSNAINEIIGVYQNRVLPFDTNAARRYAALAATARKKGRGFPKPDGYIAAIAAEHGFIVASRDTAPYEAVGVNVLNPWL